MINTNQLKNQTNIVDVVAQYVDLKKSGTSYTGLCPFHDERTPSFNVSEDKQLYNCFGCSAGGDVIKFLQEYHGWDFHQAAKELGAEIESKPLEYTAKNERRTLHRWRLPPDHQEDAEFAAQALEQGGEHYLPISTATGELVNVYDIRNKQLLCGNSYNGAHWIIKNNKPSAIAVQSLELGNTIASLYGINVAVCFTGAIMKYMCLWNHGDYKLKPALSDSCDDYLMYERPWLYWDGEKLEKREVVDV